MKNLSKIYVLCVAFIAVSFVGVSQDLKKGNLLGIHSGVLKLAKNVTKQQYLRYFKEKLKPVLEKEFQCKVVLIESIRGKNAGQMGFIWLFDSDASRNKIYKSENVLTPFGQNAMNKVQKSVDEWYKMGTIESTYTDWTVL